MVNKRSKKAVRINVMLQPATVTTINRERFKEVLYSTSGVDSGLVDLSTSHAINYVTNRAPLIGGKVYSGLEMQRRAKATFSTQPRGKRRPRVSTKPPGNPYFQNPDDDGEEEPSTLAKALAIKLPSSSSAVPPFDPLDYQPLSHTPGQHPILHPKLFSTPGSSSSPNPTASDPIIGSLAAHHKRVKQVKKRKKKKIREGKEMLSSVSGYGATSLVEKDRFILMMPPLNLLSVGAASAGASSDQDSSLRAPVAQVTRKMSKSIQQLKPLEQEHLQIEQNLIRSAYSLIDTKISNDRSLAYYNKLNENAVNSLPLNYVFRKAVDKYIRAKTSSAVVIWKRFVEIHRSHETEMGFKALQVSTIQRAVRSYLAKNIVKLQKRKREEYKLSRVIFLQGCWRRKMAFDVWATKRNVIRMAHLNSMATKIQASFRAFIYGSVPARKIVRVELHRALKCLTGRMPIHRAPLLCGLLPSEAMKLTRSLDIVTHPGVPYGTMGAPSEIRFLIASCWRIIARREEEGERQKRRWRESKRLKEEQRRKKLEDELAFHKVLFERKEQEAHAMEKFEKMSLEEAEAQRRIRRRLEKEIGEMAKLEERGHKNEAEAMAREERFQKQYAAQLEAQRKSDIMLELSMFQAEDRYAKELRHALKEMEEEKERQKIEAEHMKKISEMDGDMTKRSNRIRFHRKKKQYFKSPKNRKEYLKNKREEEERLRILDVIPSPPIIPTSKPRRRKPRNFSYPPPLPFTIAKIGGKFIRMYFEPAPSAAAVKAGEFVKKIRGGQTLYRTSLRSVAEERGRLARLQDDLDDAEHFMMTLKAKTRLERKEARGKVLEIAAEIEDQQLNVDDAEEELMQSAKATVEHLKEASNLIGAKNLPKFKFDMKRDLGNTKSGTEMSAAREWLRQLSAWCLRAEASMKLAVQDQFVNSLRVMGEVSGSDDGKKLAKEKLEGVSVVDLVSILCCSCDYRLVCYSEDTREFFLKKEEVDYLDDGDLINGEDVLDAYNVLKLGVDVKAEANENEDESVVTLCLSNVVRHAILKGFASELREGLTSLRTHDDVLRFQNNRKAEMMPSAGESKRIRSYLRMISRDSVVSEGTDEDEDGEEIKFLEIQIGKVSSAVSANVERKKEELKEIRANHDKGGGLFGLLGNEADDEENQQYLEDLKKGDTEVKKKIVTHLPLVYMEASQVKFELAIHNRQVIENVNSLDSKATMGGGLYQFPARSPEKDKTAKVKAKMKEDENQRRRTELEREEAEEKREAEDKMTVSANQELFNKWVKEDGESGGLDQALMMRKNVDEKEKSLDKMKEDKEDKGEGVLADLLAVAAEGGEEEKEVDGAEGKVLGNLHVEAAEEGAFEEEGANLDI